jgi:hypothetical protein
MQFDTHRIRRPSKPKTWDLDLWNSLNPVFSPCELTLDDGSKVITKTRSVAWNLGHGQAVVLVDGRAGGQMLERLKMLETHKP